MSWRAVDGNTDRIKDGCAITEHGEKHSKEWWAVDLRKRHRISELVVDIGYAVHGYSLTDVLWIVNIIYVSY